MLDDPLASKQSSIFAIERVVAFVIGPVLMVVAAYVMRIATTWFPGIHLSTGEVAHVLEVTIAGVVLLVLKWLHGRQIPALLHTPTTVLAAVQGNPVLLAAVAGEVQKLLPAASLEAGVVGESVTATGPTSPVGAAGPPDGSPAGSPEFVDDTPPPGDFALAGSSAPLAQS